MAKRSIRKTDSDDTTAPAKRRRTAAADVTKASKPAAVRSRQKTAAPAGIAKVVTGGELDAPPNGDSESLDISHEQIAERAYHIYLERGYPGDQFQDWLAAERQLRERYVRSR